MKKILFAWLMACTPLFAAPHSNPLLLINVESGEILLEQGAGESWYPASLTKMMTAYVTLYAIKQNRLSLEHPLRVSPVATRQAPSKMGFKAGSLITVENALKIIMVKSANDVSYTLAEGVSGSLAQFVQEMNSHAQRLGMSGTHFINANGLPGRGQVTTARDMAILGRALLLEFPNMAELFDIPALSHGQKTIRNTNHLLGRYPNITGIKTGFICASGFNVVASVYKNGYYYIAVVLGAQTARERAQVAADAFEKTTTIRGTGKTVFSLANTGGAPPDIRQDVCKRRVKGEPVVADTGEDFEQQLAARYGEGETGSDFLQREALRRERAQQPVSLLSTYAPSRAPEAIYLGAKPGVNLPVLGVAESKQKEPNKKLTALVAAPKLETKKKLAPIQEATPTKKVEAKKQTTQKQTISKKPEVKKPASPKPSALPKPVVKKKQEI